jgi:hypothetical protein
MPISSQIDRNSNLTTFVMEGLLDVDGVISSLKPIYEDPDHPPTLNIIWDLREIIPDQSIKDEDLKEIVTYLSRHAAKRIGGKTAIVARAEFEYNVSKKYELFVQLEGLSIAVGVFRSLGEAMIWLGLSYEHAEYPRKAQN